MEYVLVVQQILSAVQIFAKMAFVLLVPKTQHVVATYAIMGFAPIANITHSV